MRKKMNRTSVIILLVAALTVAVPSLIGYSYYERYDHARKGEQLLIAIKVANTDGALSLLKAGADPNYVTPHDYANVTALEVACERSNVEVVRYLLAHGVKPWKEAQDKASFIRIAVSNPNYSSSQTCNEIMQMLVERGADVNAVAEFENLPLILAIENSQNEGVKFLVNHGANVNLKTDTGWPPLSIAAAIGNTVAVRLLLKAGADPSQCRATLDQVTSNAEKAGYKEIVALLKDAMAKRKATATTGLKK